MTRGFGNGRSGAKRQQNYLTILERSKIEKTRYKESARVTSTAATTAPTLPSPENGNKTHPNYKIEYRYAELSPPGLWRVYLRCAVLLLVLHIIRDSVTISMVQQTVKFYLIYTRFRHLL